MPKGLTNAPWTKYVAYIEHSHLVIFQHFQARRWETYVLSTIWRTAERVRQPFSVVIQNRSLIISIKASKLTFMHYVSCFKEFLSHNAENTYHILLAWNRQIYIAEPPNLHWSTATFPRRLDIPLKVVSMKFEFFVLHGAIPMASDITPILYPALPNVDTGSYLSAFVKRIDRCSHHGN